MTGPSVMTAATRQMVSAALSNKAVTRRYWAKVARPELTGYTCWPWIGSLHPKGHGRFWVGNIPSPLGPRDVCVIAHRFGFALAHGADALTDAVVLAHTCDEPSCQNPDHLMASTWGENLEQWHMRRWTPGSPLRDVRGPGKRARDIREALRTGGDLRAALEAGRGPLDAGQIPLW